MLCPKPQLLDICPFHRSCGGCQYQDVLYETELELKEQYLRKVLCETDMIQPEIIASIIKSPRQIHYRNRIDLKLAKRRDGKIHIGFSPVGRGPVVEIESCQLAMEKISEFIPRLRQEASGKLPAKYRMANLVVRCGDSGEVRWGGIGKRSNKLSEDHYFYTDIADKRIYYSLDTFFQANLSILPALRAHIRAMDIWHEEVCFFDLYGGVGLFSLFVHDLIRRVVLIENNSHAVRLARWNMMQNHIPNMEIFSGNVEDVLPELLTNFSSNCNVVMVDPPRDGLSQSAIRLLNNVSNTGHLLYLSCSPESLARDLVDLVNGGWKILKVTPFDFFPRTRHVETLAHLTR